MGSWALPCERLSARKAHSCLHRSAAGGGGLSSEGGSAAASIFKCCQVGFLGSCAQAPPPAAAAQTGLSLESLRVFFWGGGGEGNGSAREALRRACFLAGGEGGAWQECGFWAAEFRKPSSLGSMAPGLWGWGFYPGLLRTLWEMLAALPRPG